MRQLWVRTEASTRIGLGHFMRCFAIAEAARMEGINVTFLLNEVSAVVYDRTRQIGADTLCLDTPIGTSNDAHRLHRLIPKGEWLLLDSYSFDADYYDHLHTDYRLIVLDDLAEVKPLKAHMIINAAASAHDLPYDDIAPLAVKCLGPDYAQIRREFCRPYPDVTHPHLCVMFGGSDPNGLTATCAKALLEATETIAIRLIVGPANAHVDALRALSQAHPRLKLYLSPDNVAEVLFGADLVVTAAGGSIGEVAALGLAALVLVVVDNQAAALKACPYPVMDARQDWPEDFALWVQALLGDPDTRLDIARRAHALIDGRGADRIIEAMRHV